MRRAKRYARLVVVEEEVNFILAILLMCEAVVLSRNPDPLIRDIAIYGPATLATPFKSTCQNVPSNKGHSKLFDIISDPASK